MRRRFIRWFIFAEVVTVAFFFAVGIRWTPFSDYEMPVMESLMTPASWSNSHHHRRRPSVTAADEQQVVPQLAATVADGLVEYATTRIGNSTTFRPTRIPVVHMNLYLFKDARKFVKHCEIDGLNHSNYLTLVTDPIAWNSTKDWVWMGSLWTSMPRVCDAFSNLIVKVQRIRQQHGLSTKWPIHMMDWSDEGSTWNSTTKAIDVGRMQTWNDWSSYSAAPVQHIPITVRSDFVQAIESYTRDQLHVQFTTERELTDALVQNVNRSLDVVHFWPAPMDDAAGKVDNRKRAQLRNTVSRTLQELHNSNPHILAFAGLHGEAKDQGREQVQTEYLKAMLQYKIVVVAQKDGWEDHYRLFEALLSGALVMSDVMLTLPSGLQDGLVFYRNMDEMKERIEYYLQHPAQRRTIAKHGRQIALAAHRSWHWMERVILGKVISEAK